MMMIFVIRFISLTSSGYTIDVHKYQHSPPMLLSDNESDEDDSGDLDDIIRSLELSMSQLYKMRGNISSNLSKLFDDSEFENNQKIASNQNGNWKPPPFHGLSNSYPIVPQKKSAIVYYDRGYEEDEDKDSSSYASVEEEVNWESRLESLSSDLRKALGYENTSQTKTNWVPPYKTGLANSERILPLITNNANYNKLSKNLYSQERNQNEDNDGSELADDEGDDFTNYFAASRLNLEEIPMSSSLRKILGFSPSTTMNTVQYNEDGNKWIPPSKPGLENSLPVLLPTRQQLRPFPPSNSASQSASHQHNRNINKNNNSLPVFAVNSNKQFDDYYAEKYNIYEGYNEEDEEEEDEDEEDDENYITTIESGLSTVALSPDLMKLMGRTPSNNINKNTGMPLNMVTWKPPARSGLKNSAPIVATVYNQSTLYGENDEDDDDDDDDDYIDEEDDERGLDENGYPRVAMSSNLLQALGIQSTSVSSTVNTISDWKPPSHAGLHNSTPLVVTKYNQINISSIPPSVSNVINNNQYHQEDEEDQYYDDEEEDDEDYDHLNNDDSNELKVTGGMSLNLMKALGLDTSHMEPVDTDWKPPSFSGLTNSSPIRPNEQNQPSKRSPKTKKYHK
jgi:hypothetical protein